MKDFDKLFDLWNLTNKAELSVSFNFSDCCFLRQNAVAFLGGLVKQIEKRSGTVSFAWDTLKDDVKANLKQNGFLMAFGCTDAPWTGNSIPYRQDHTQDSNAIVEYLKNNWLGAGGMSMHLSANLRNAIVGRVFEIYANAFEHSQHSKSDINVFSCGQYFPRTNELKLTVIDFGIGIPTNVRNFQQNPTLSADKAIQWAFLPGTTTDTRKVVRGAGLDLLKDFVRLNHGHLEIFSHEGHVNISKDQEIYENRTNYFHGTIVNITFLNDDKWYKLVGEPDDKSIF